jgi:hypothetical protein
MIPDATPTADVSAKPRRFRRLRIAMSVFFGVVTVALCVLWVRSYSWRDLAWARVPDFGSGSIASLNGKFQCLILWESTESANASFAWGRSRIPAKEASRSLMMSHVQHRWSGLGFELVNFPNPFAVAIPYWCLTPLFAAGCYFIAGQSQFRFSLRTMLIATTLAAVVLGAIAYASR